MGLDLKLLIVDGEMDGSPFYSHSMLELERRAAFWDLIFPIEEQHGRDVPECFSSFVGRKKEADLGYGKTIDTPYGEHLKYVRVSHLLPLAKAKPVQDNWANRAAWAWMKAAPPDTMVALYWH